MVQEAVGDTGKTMTGTQHYDLIIIGGGPSGQGAAEFAAFAGRRVLVIERKVLGGLVAEDQPKHSVRQLYILRVFDTGPFMGLLTNQT